MRHARRVLGAVVLAASLGLAAAVAALPPHITVTKPTRMDIIHGGQVSGKMSLAVGTTLDVDGVSGEYVLVRIRLLKGRVLAKDTDIASPDLGVQDTSQGPQANATAQVAKAPPSTTAAAKPVGAPSAPTDLARATAQTAAVSPRPPLDRRPPGPGAATRFLFLAVCAATIASYWLLFAKLGKPGWAAVVPVYNLVVLTQIIGKPTWWVILFFIPFVNLVVCVLSGFAIAESFGRSKAFGLGVALLPWIFVPVLVFGLPADPGGNSAITEGL
jgi:hypothetical protein